MVSSAAHGMLLGATQHSSTRMTPHTDTMIVQVTNIILLLWFAPAAASAARITSACKVHACNTCYGAGHLLLIMPNYKITHMLHCACLP
jgi:hypothetical protein